LTGFPPAANIRHMRKSPAGHPRARVLFLGLMLSLAYAAGTFLGAAAAQWDRAAAEKSLVQARAMREALASTSDPQRSDYLRCAEKYRVVYRYDPHYGGSDDAIFEAGIVFQEAGVRFGNVTDFRRAARQFQYLLSDYERSPHCAEAVLRLGDLLAGPLQDPAAAEETYELLKTRYRRSKAAAELAERQSAPTSEDHAAQAATQAAAEQARAPAAQGAREEEHPSATTETSASGPRTSVLNIRHWSRRRCSRILTGSISTFREPG